MLAVIVGVITGFVAPEKVSNTDPTPNEISTPPSVSATPSTTRSQTGTTSLSPPSQRPRSEARPDIPPAPSDEGPVPTSPPTTERPSQLPDGGGSGRARPALPPGGAGVAHLVTEPTAPPEPTAPETTDTAAEPSHDRFSERSALVGFLGAFLTGLAVVAVASAARSGGHVRGQQPRYRATPDPAVGPGGTRIMPAIGAISGDRSDRDSSDHDRAALIHALIHLRDRTTSGATGEHIDQALREVGVTEDAPVGQRFDPTRHEAGGFESAPDSGSRDIISGIEVMGYLDRDGSVLRTPVVTVYR